MKLNRPGVNTRHAMRNPACVARAPWKTPRVIASDLGDARADTIIPGGDGSISGYPYGS